MADLTAIVLTKNESKNIGACLDSVKGFAKRVVVVDSGSTDDTVEIAQSKGAEVYTHDFDYYAKQFNWGIDNTNINTKWILRLDADERFTEKLRKETELLMSKHSSDNVNGITMEAWLYFLGKKLRYGASKKRKLMIFKKGIGRIEDRKRDAHSIISEGTTVATKNRFIHHDFKSIDNFISKYNYYATREMEDYLEHLNGNSSEIHTDKKIKKTRNKKFGMYYKTPKFLRAKLWFIYNYYLRLGFLDGREGYIYHFLECYWYRYLTDAKIYEKEIINSMNQEKLKSKMVIK